MAIDKNRILVCGGGIAGLTCALALARKGYSVEVFEQAEKIEPVGAGLQLSPNAMYVLSELDLMRKLQLVATAPSRLRIFDAETENQIARFSLGSQLVRRYGYPYYVVHRADLLQVLLAACLDNTNVNVHLDHRVVDLVEHDNGLTLYAQRKDGSGREFTGSLLVAADGVWSKIRTLFMAQAAPVYSGLTAWRAMLRKDALVREDVNTIGAGYDLENTCAWFHPGSHAVSYPVRSGQALNMVFIRREPEPERDMDGRFEFHKLEPFSREVQLAGWHEKWPGRLVDDRSWTRWPLFHIPAGNLRKARWHEGPVIMIGDAAHSMLPFSAQGAAMAIEDAHQLADCLARYKDREMAFPIFVNRRRGRIAKTVALANKNRTIYHMGKPFSEFRNFSMKIMGTRMMLMRHDWLYSWKGY